MKKIPIVILACLATACYNRPKFTSGLEGQPLPGFTLTLKDSITPFNTATIEAGKPFLVLLYQPYCPYCNSQVEDIVKNIAAFKDTRLYLVTSNPYAAIKQFSRHYHLDSYPNIVLIRDSSSHLFSYFKDPGVPYLAFYDNQKKLKQVIVGKTDVDVLKNILTN